MVSRSLEDTNRKFALFDLRFANRIQQVKSSNKQYIVEFQFNKILAHSSIQPNYLIPFSIPSLSHISVVLGGRVLREENERNREERVSVSSEHCKLRDARARLSFVRSPVMGCTCGVNISGCQIDFRLPCHLQRACEYNRINTCNWGNTPRHFCTYGTIRTSNNDLSMISVCPTNEHMN